MQTSLSALQDKNFVPGVYFAAVRFDCSLSIAFSYP